jgi:hypothetical protein
MRTRLAIAVLAVVPSAVRAQARLSTDPLTPATTGQLVFAKAYPISGSDLFVGYLHQLGSPGTFDRFGYRALERPGPFGFGPPPSTASNRFGVAGLLNEHGGDRLPDVAYLDTVTLGPDLFFGDSPLVLRQPPSLTLGFDTGSKQPLSMAHLLATSGDVLVYTNDTSLKAVDFDSTGAVASQWNWPEPGGSLPDDKLMQLRLSSSARSGSGGVDLARNRSIGPPFYYGLDLFWLVDDAPPLSSALYFQPTPVTVPVPNEPRGAGALDVDGDLKPDLVVCVVDESTSPYSGKLVWIKNTDDPGQLATVVPQDFQDLGGLGIANPLLLRPIDLDGTPAIAVWDQGSSSIVVVTSEGSPPQLRTWRGPAMSGWVVYDMVAGDVVGSGLADLVVVYVDPQQVSPAVVQVFPDSGDAAPVIAWSPGLPPARAACGFNLPLQVQATDDGAVAAVEWFVNGSATPVSIQTAPPYTFSVPASALPCAAPNLQVMARAVDDVGLWSEVSATIPLFVDAPPTISWSPGFPPIQAPNGFDLPLQIEATDDVQVVGVQWFLNGSATPAMTQTVPPYAFTIPGASLCGASSVLVRVRAVDDVGQSSELTAAIPLVPEPPMLQLSGAGQTTLVTLAPGESRVVLSAQVAGACDTLSWLPASLPPGVTGTPAGNSYSVVVREIDYPAVLANADLRGAVTAQASGPGGITSATAQLLVDASQLLKIQQTSDRASLGPGDLALLTATVSSNIAVSLGKVRIDFLLDGLDPAGPLAVAGTALDAHAAAGSASAQLAAVPGGGQPITLRLPVRCTLARGGLSRIQAVALPSETALSAEQPPEAVAATPPGLGCSHAGNAPAWPILLVLSCALAARARSARRWRRQPPPG